MEPTEENPYESPSDESQPAAEKRRKTKWRIIVVVLLYIFGGMCVFSGSTLIYIALDLAQNFEEAEALLPRLLTGAVSVILTGVLLIVSGYLCWRGKWWYSILAFVLSVLAYYTACKLLAGTPFLN